MNADMNYRCVAIAEDCYLGVGAGWCALMHRAMWDPWAQPVLMRPIIPASHAYTLTIKSVYYIFRLV